MTSVLDDANDPAPEAATAEVTPISQGDSTPAVMSDVDRLLASIQSPLIAKRNYKIMIYSLPDGGKTTLIGNIPNSLMVDSEDGNIVLTPATVAKNMKRIPFKSFYQLELLTEQFRVNNPAFADIETVSLDTVSTIHKDGLAEVKENQYKLAGAIVNRSKLETEDHTENNEHIRRIIRDFIKYTDRNLVLTAHSRTVTPKDGEPRTFPDFSEKLANTIAGMMDTVGYLYWTEIEGKRTQVLKVRGSNTIAAKTRITTMPDSIIEPTWEKIMAFVEEHNALVDAGLVSE